MNISVFLPFSLAYTPKAFIIPLFRSALSLSCTTSDKNRARNYIRSRVNPDEVWKRVEITSKRAVTLHVAGESIVATSQFTSAQVIIV